VPMNGPLDVDFTVASRDPGDLYPQGGPMPARRFAARGTVTGPRTAMDVRLAVEAEGLTARGRAVQRLDATAALTDLGLPSSRMVLDGTAAGIAATDSLVLDSAEFHVGFAADTAGISVGVQVDSVSRADAHVAVRLGGAAPTVVLDRAALTRRDATWELQQPGRLTYRGGEIRFEDFALAHEEQRLALDGTLDLAGRQDLRFALENLSLEDLQALAGVEPSASGTLNGSVALAGTDRAPTLRGELSLATARAGGLSIRRLDARFDYANRRLGLDAQLVPEPAPAASSAGDDDPGALVLRGSVPLDLAFRDASQRFPDAPLDLHVESRGLRLDSFRPAPPGGAAAPPASQSADGADTAARPGATGPLAFRLDLTGTPSAPLLESTFSLEGSRINSLDVERLSGRFGYAQRELKLEAELVARMPAAAAKPAMDEAANEEAGTAPLQRSAEGERATLAARGSFPVDLALGPVADRTPDLPMDVRLESRGLTLGIARSFSPRVTEASGPVEVGVSLSGTPSEPRYSGALTVRDGAFRMGRDAVRYSDIEATVRFDNDRITLEEIQVSSPGGRARVTGGIALREMALGDIDARLEARRFTLIGEEDRQLVIDADLDLSGTTQAPSVVGSVNVEQLEWPLPERSDKEVIDVDEAILYVRAEGDTAPQPPPPPDVWRETLLDVDVTIEDDAFLRSPQALIVLEGDLSIAKERGADRPSLAGNIDVVRGFYSDFGRRFEVAEGQVAFFGTPDLDPGLNVRAVTEVENSDTGQDVEISLILGGTVGQLTFDVASNPPYEKSEIFSLLLFGTTTPGQGQETEFQSTISRVAAGQATGSLSRALASELGLDLLEIQPGAGGGAGFRAGKYVANDVFVTYSQSSAPEQENQLGVQYRLSRQWTLETEVARRQFGADLFYEFQY
nr:translocation/assembly module TamB domain-containing protein [Gemmatimonadota bacterium]